MSASIQKNSNFSHLHRSVVKQILQDIEACGVPRKNITLKTLASKRPGYYDGTGPDFKRRCQKKVSQLKELTFDNYLSKLDEFQIQFFASS